MQHLEDFESKTLVHRLDHVAKVEFSHLAQSTRAKNIGVAMKNKAMGVRPGIPDYMIYWPKKYTNGDNELIFIEMKKQKGGRVSDSQKKRIELLNESPSVYAYVCNGYKEALEALRTHTVATKHYMFPI